MEKSENHNKDGHFWNASECSGRRKLSTPSAKACSPPFDVALHFLPSSHLLVERAEEMIEIVHTDKAEARKLDVGDDKQRQG